MITTLVPYKYRPLSLFFNYLLTPNQSSHQLSFPPHTVTTKPNTPVNNIIKQIINIRSRVSRRDVLAIYACALTDIALTALLIGGILFFIV